MRVTGLVLCVALVLGLSLARGANVTEHFSGASGGYWGTATSWSGGLAPNNGANNFFATINGLASNVNVVLRDNNFTVSALQVDAGDSLTWGVGAGNARSLTIAGSGFPNSLLNNGTITVNDSTASAANQLALLSIASGSFQNNGTIQLNNTATPVGSATAATRLLLGTTSATMNAVNNGQIILNHTAAGANTLTAIRLGGNVNLTGSGQVILGSNAKNQIRVVTGLEATHPKLTIGGGQTILGGGTIGAGNLDFAIGTGGSLNVNSGTGMAINTFDPWTNAGTVSVGSTRTLNSAQDYQQTAGSTQVATGGVFLASDIFLDGGISTINGTMGAATVTIGGSGAINGIGAITSDVTNGGTLTPGNGMGTMSINGNYIQTGAGDFSVELGGMSPGQWGDLGVSEDAALGGTLDVRFAHGFLPAFGSSWVIMTSDGGLDGNGGYGITGAFSRVNGPHGLGVYYLDTDANGYMDQVELIYSPEPGTWTLLLGSLTLMVFMVRRSRRAV
jgi:hypothetical protein